MRKKRMFWLKQKVSIMKLNKISWNKFKRKMNQRSRIKMFYSKYTKRLCQKLNIHACSTQIHLYFIIKGLWTLSIFVSFVEASLHYKFKSLKMSLIWTIMKILGFCWWIGAVLWSSHAHQAAHKAKNNP